MRDRARVGRLTTLLAAMTVAGAAAAAQSGGANARDDQRSAEVDFNQASAIGTAVRVVLSNGDVITGSILENTGGILGIDNTVLGRVDIPITDISSVTSGFADNGSSRRRSPGEPREPVPEAPTDPPADPPPAVEPTAPPATEPEPEPEPKPKPPPKPAKPNVNWDSEISFGLTGNEGVRDTVQTDVAFKTRRRSRGGTFNFDTRYRFSEVEGDRNVNRITYNARNDFRFDDSRWSLQLRTSGEANEFRNYDFRFAFNGTLGYRFIDNQETNFRARVGGGAVREFGSPTDDEFDPELNFAADLEHRLTARQTFKAAGELFPDLDELGEYRAIVDSSWEMRLENEPDLRLLLGVRYEFDSEAVNINESELSYTARIVFGF
ncbi:MAG: DUF481 domain-containing protein [Planctomycetota bacterium]